MIRPLPLATLAFAAGLAVGLRAPIPAAAPFAVLTALALAFPLLPNRRQLVLLAAFAATGAASGRHAAAAARADCRAQLPDGRAIEVAGSFTARPATDGTVRFRISQVRIGGRTFPCRGTVRARVPTDLGALHEVGAPTTAWGQWWASPHGGAWPRPAEYAGTLLLDSVRTGAPQSGSSSDPRAALRAAAQARLRDLFGDHAPLAEALVLAQDDGLDRDVRDRFTRSGLAHVLSISGLHVGLITGALLLLARLLRLSPRLGTAVAAAATIAYVLFLGAPYAAARAMLQILLVLGARLMQRPADPYALLAAAALVLLAADPLALLNPGFQLSFAGIGGIIALRARLLDALPRRVPRLLRDGAATSLAATLATAPITVLHFGQIAPIGILANFAAIPVVGLAVPAIALALGAAAVAPPVGRFLAGGAGLTLAALDRIAAIAAAVPGGSLLVPRDAVVGWALAALACALITGRLAAGARRAHYRPTASGDATGGPARAGIRRGVRGAVASGVAAAVLVAWPIAAQRVHGDDLEIHVIDVGQGDAIAIRSPAGRWILVDAGPRSADYDAGRARVVPFLLRHGVRRLEALILTHPDADHIGGADAVLEAFPVGTIVDPGIAMGKPLYLEVIREAGREGARWIAAREGQVVRFDGVVIRFLHPIAGRLDGQREANELSVAFALEYGRFDALFLGDAPAAVERTIVARHGTALDVELLKVAHHGSATSTSEALLDAADPAVAVISVGRHNRYGHPDPNVIRRLMRHGIRVLRTDRDGAIHVRAHPDGGMEVETSR